MEARQKTYKRRTKRERDPRSKRVYNSRAWQRLRAWKLERAPICEIRIRCHGAPATEVDHIRPIAQGGEAYDPDNLQSTCHECHSVKTNTTDREAALRFSGSGAYDPDD